MSESPSSNFHRPLIISGPSGVGKSTFLRRLFAEFPEKFGFSVSHTTRSPRPGEIDGTDYYFVPQGQFDGLIKEGAFIEHVKFCGNSYGTTAKAVREIQDRGRRCILEIDAQGVQQIKRHRKELDPVSLFISPPSMTYLVSSLWERGTESEETVQRRLEAALSEITYAKQPNAHDMVIVSDDEDRAYNLLKKVALGEEITSDIIPPFKE